MVLLECEQYSVKMFFLGGKGCCFDHSSLFFVDSIFACFGQSAIHFGSFGSFYCFVSAVSFRCFGF